MELNQPWWIDVPKVLVVINVLLLAVAYVTWLERKLIGRMQLRYGPNRAGPYGLLAADRRPRQDDPQGELRPEPRRSTCLFVAWRRSWPCSPRSTTFASSRGDRLGDRRTTT